MELLLRTPTGSRLYGLAHADSDEDYFEVYPGKRRMSQRMNGNLDVARVSLDQFLMGLNKGTPQYLEALWSQQKTTNELQWLNYYLPNYWETFRTYRRTSENFWLDGVVNAKPKMVRHSWRLWLNLQDFMEHGRFNPTLTASQVAWLNERTEKEDCPLF